MRSNLRRTYWKKVFEENRHTWLFNKKIEDQKVLNSLVGLEHRNEMFDLYNEGADIEDLDAMINQTSSDEDPKSNMFKKTKTLSKTTIAEKQLLKLRRMLKRE